MAVFDATSRILAEQQAPITRRQKALDKLTQSIVGGFEAQAKGEQQQTKTRRQQALEGLQFQQGLAKAGVPITPEQGQQVQAAFQTGEFEGLTPLLTQQAQQAQIKREEKKLGKAEKLKEDRRIKKDARDNRGFVKLGTTVINPTSRRRFGRLQQNIDTADAAKTLTASLGVLPGQFADPKESHKRKIERFNSATQQQKAELVAVLTRLLTQGAPTEAGQAHLLPTSLQGSIGETIQRLSASPQGGQEGELIANIVDTIERERSFNVGRQRESLGKIGAAFGHLQKVDPERFAAIIEGDPLEFVPGPLTEDSEPLVTQFQPAQPEQPAQPPPPVQLTREQKIELLKQRGL